MRPVPRHVIQASRCRNCGKALGDPRPWPGMAYCDQACLDAKLDAVMREAIGPARADQTRGRPKSGQQPWCVWCGDDLASGKRFCSPECRSAFAADIRKAKREERACLFLSAGISGSDTPRSSSPPPFISRG